jgi:hypothetical protein
MPAAAALGLTQIASRGDTTLSNVTDDSIFD